MPPTPSEVMYLSPQEQDIAAQLKSYSRKLDSMRDANLHAVAAADSMTPKKSKKPKVSRSTAEDWKRARTIQRLIQGACVAHFVLTTMLAAMSAPSLLLYLVGDGAGLAASFASVQRNRRGCLALSVAFLVSSIGCPVQLGVALARAGSPDDLVDEHVVHDAVTGPAVLFGVLDVIASVLATILAGYVLWRPLELYRYETVAEDEEAAEMRSVRLGGRGRSLSLEPASEPNSPEGSAPLYPINAWHRAEETHESGGGAAPGLAISKRVAPKPSKCRRRAPATQPLGEVDSCALTPLSLFALDGASCSASPPPPNVTGTRPKSPRWYVETSRRRGWRWAARCPSCCRHPPMSAPPRRAPRWRRAPPPPTARQSSRPGARARRPEPEPEPGRTVAVAAAPAAAAGRRLRSCKTRRRPRAGRGPRVVGGKGPRVRARR